MMKRGDERVEVHYKYIHDIQTYFGTLVHLSKCHHRKFNEIKYMLPRGAYYLCINNNQINIIYYSSQSTFHTYCNVILTSGLQNRFYCLHFTRNNFRVVKSRAQRPGARRRQKWDSEPGPWCPDFILRLARQRKSWMPLVTSLLSLRRTRTMRLSLSSS